MCKGLKKLLASVTCIMVLTGILSGCGGSSQDAKKPESSPAPTSKAETSAPKKQTAISFWFPSENEQNDQYYQNAAKEFEKVNPNIKVNVNMIPITNEDQETRLNAAKLSGTFPDVYMSFLIFLGSRGSKGDFLDLAPYVDKWEEKGDILPNVLELGKVNNKLYGMGFYPAPVVFVYRKDYFQEAGLDPEKPPKTWEEIEAYAEKLAKRDSTGKLTRAGIDIPMLAPEKQVKIFMWSNGNFSSFIDEKANKPAFTQPSSIEALNFLVKLKNKNLIIPYDENKLQDEPFIKGNSAMAWLNGFMAKKLMDDPNLKGKIGLGPVLERKQKAAFCGFRFFTIGADSKNKDESWEFIKFMMSKEQVKKRMVDLKIAPVRASLQDEYISLDPVYNKSALEAIKYGKGNEPVSWIMLAHKYLYEAYDEAMGNKKSAEAALKDAEQKLLKELENLKK